MPNNITYFARNTITFEALKLLSYFLSAPVTNIIRLKNNLERTKTTYNHLWDRTHQQSTTYTHNQKNFKSFFLSVTRRTQVTANSKQMTNFNWFYKSRAKANTLNKPNVYECSRSGCALNNGINCNFITLSRRTNF